MKRRSQDAGRIAAEHSARIRRYFNSKGLSAEDAEDLVQDALCAIVDSFPNFQGTSSVSTWVYAICRNIYRTHSYRLAKARNITYRLHQEDVAREEEATLVQAIVDSLPVQLRSVYVLYYQKGLTVRESAESMSRPVGTVKYLLSELRRHFRDQWM